MIACPGAGGLNRLKMCTRPQRRSSERTQTLRKQAGAWLRELRERRGLSQRELAARVGAEYYTLISQLETGRGRIPPDRYLVWAHALGIDKREFVRTLMSFYDPVTYGILFGRQRRAHKRTRVTPCARTDRLGLHMRTGAAEKAAHDEALRRCGALKCSAVGRGVAPCGHRRSDSP